MVLGSNEVQTLSCQRAAFPQAQSFPSQLTDHSLQQNTSETLIRLLLLYFIYYYYYYQVIVITAIICYY